jgi:hypothetical protein
MSIPKGSFSLLVGLLMTGGVVFTGCSTDTVVGPSETSVFGGEDQGGDGHNNVDQGGDGHNNVDQGGDGHNN